MKKKVFLSILVMICFLFGINSVKAEEGENKIGEKTTYAKYCNKGDCYFLAFNKDEDEFRLFHGDGKTEVDDSDLIENALSIFGNVCFFDCTRVYVSTEELPTKYLYYFSIIHKDSNDLHERDFFFITATSLEEIRKEIYSHEKTEIQETKFDLVYYYGSDYVEIDSDYVKQKVDELAEKTKEINGGKIEYDEGTAGCGILTPAIKNKINWVLDFIKYAGTALAIILGAADFLKATLADDDAASKKAFQKFINRLIAAVLLFLIPLIIQFLFTAIDNPLIQIPGFNKDEPTCGIGVSENK